MTGSGLDKEIEAAVRQAMVDGLLLALKMHQNRYNDAYYHTTFEQDVSEEIDRIGGQKMTPKTSTKTGGISAQAESVMVPAVANRGAAASVCRKKFGSGLRPRPRGPPRVLLLVAIVDLISDLLELDSIAANGSHDALRDSVQRPLTAGRVRGVMRPLPAAPIVRARDHTRLRRSAAQAGSLLPTKSTAFF